MKQYTKPTAIVVDLAVKETIADLPVAFQGISTETVNSGASVTITTYNLATAQQSTNGNSVQG